jgi:hypothetical protein
MLALAAMAVLRSFEIHILPMVLPTEVMVVRVEMCGFKRSRARLACTNWQDEE